MKKMNLYEAVKKQIEFCKRFEYYKCAVITKINIGDLIDYIETVFELTLDFDIYMIRTNEIGTSGCIYFKNNSRIELFCCNDLLCDDLRNIRGKRYNGCIIDSCYHYDSHTQCLPIHIMPMMHNELSDRNHVIFAESIDSVKERMFIVDFKEENNMSINARMIGEDCYTQPIMVKETNGEKIIYYDALGIPKECIIHKDEFINKTKQTFLNITDNYDFWDDGMGYENHINVHLFIDTDVYDRYAVTIRDGLIRVTLSEIKNERPMLFDISSK